MVIESLEFKVDDIASGEKVSFGDKLSRDDVLKAFTVLVDSEVSGHEPYVFALKNLDVEMVADIIRYSLGRADYANPTILANVMVLVRNYNTLDDSFFKSETVFVSTLENLLDLKLALKADIRKFNRDVCVEFISCLKYASKFEFNFTECGPCEVSRLHRAVIFSMDVFTLSSMLSNCEPFTSDDLKPVANALPFVAEFAAKVSMLDTMFKNMSSGR